MTDQSVATAEPPRTTSLAEARPWQVPFKMVPSMEMLENPDLFAHYQRVARLFSESQLVPKHFQGKMSDCFIALSIARATSQDPLLVMQNLYVANGRAGWYATYMIARANASGKFKGPIRWTVTDKGRMQGRVPVKVGWDAEKRQSIYKDTFVDVHNIAVTAYADLVGVEGESRVDVTVDMTQASKDGWLTNEKYQSIPEQMLRWRSATWLIRLYCPEVMLGLATADEIEDEAVNAAGLDIGGAAKHQPKTARPKASHFAPSGPVVDVEPKPEMPDIPADLDRRTPKATPAPEPASEPVEKQEPVPAEAMTYSVVDENGEIVADQVEFDEAAPVLQRLIATCQTLKGLGALSEHNADLITDMEGGAELLAGREADIKGRLAETRARRKANEAAPAPEPAPPTSPAPEPPTAPAAAAPQPSHDKDEPPLTEEEQQWLYRVELGLKDGKPDWDGFFREIVGHVNAMVAAGQGRLADRFRAMNKGNLESLGNAMPGWQSQIQLIFQRAAKS